jgi:hypothetical protein
MNIARIGGVTLASLFAVGAIAQDSTSLNRQEVTAAKADIVTVQTAMGEPAGYVKDDESFDLPTDFRPARAGKFWPIDSGVSLRYKDRAAHDATATTEQLNQDVQARMTAAAARGDFAALAAMSQEATARALAASSAMQSAKPDMNVNIRFNSGASATIDPDAVVFEKPGVIALREKDSGSSTDGRVTVYLDPVALKNSETLSKVELKTPQDGVSNKTGVFNITISLDGRLADAEAWAKAFNTGPMLGVIDPQ